MDTQERAAVKVGQANKLETLWHTRERKGEERKKIEAYHTWTRSFPTTCGLFGIPDVCARPRSRTAPLTMAATAKIIL
jgi:hypothetical protein